MGDMQRSIRFPSELADKLRALAEREDRSFSWVVVRACEAFVSDGWATAPAAKTISTVERVEHDPRRGSPSPSLQRHREDS